jgi:drug/metabolite transporter (DMT)-like permease
MNWIAITITGYALLAVESVISKYILAARMKSWQLYTFYVGIFSVFSLGFAPFGLKWLGAVPFFISFFAGITFFLSLAFLFRALIVSSVSRVYILFGSSSAIAATLLANLMLGETFSAREIGGIFFLIAGGVIISYKFREGRFFSHWRGAVLSGFLAAFSMILLKDGYNEQSFVNGYIVSRMGILAAALGSLAIPEFRKAVFQGVSKRKQRENIENLGGTIVAKTTAGLGTLLVNYGVSLGSVAVISSLVSVQYLLTFIFALVLSNFLKNIFVEKFSVLNILSKTAGILAVALGTLLVIFKY